MIGYYFSEGNPPSDPCDTNPCGDGAQCNNQGDTYTCTCDARYRYDGTKCGG